MIVSLYDRAGAEEFLSDDKVKEQIFKFRAGNVGRHKTPDNKRERK